MNEKIDWQQVINKTRELTGLSLVSISEQSEVGLDVIQSMSSGRAKDPRFSNGVKLVVYAGEKGVKLNDVLKAATNEN